jgi:membrane protein implicated in regulation of membrane protease activity
MHFWHWIALGFLLMAVELLLPTYFFLWLGGAAVAVGIIFWILPNLSIIDQGTLFAIFGIAGFFASQAMLKHKKAHTNGPQLNKRGSQMIGEIVVLETAIENGHGKATVGDTLWSVEGPDAPVGARVKIVGTEGTVLRVENI